MSALKSIRTILLMAAVLGAVSFSQASTALPTDADLTNRFGKWLGTNQVRVTTVPGDASTLKVGLGTLSEEQFSKLRKAFASPHVPGDLLPKYDSARSYGLLDFLPPKMQASYGRNFWARENAPWMKSLTGADENSLFYETNCWSTTYDVLLPATEALTTYVYFPAPNEIDAVLSNDAYSKTINEDELRPYDYILYYENDAATGKPVLVHTAVSLGMGLVFEKTGGSELDFYVISTSESTMATRVHLAGSKGVSVSYRRLTKALPTPDVAFGARSLGKLSDSDLAKVPVALRRYVAVQDDALGGRSYQLIRPLKITWSPNGLARFDKEDPISVQFRLPQDFELED